MREPFIPVGSNGPRQFYENIATSDGYVVRLAVCRAGEMLDSSVKASTIRETATAANGGYERVADSSGERRPSVGRFDGIGRRRETRAERRGPRPAPNKKLNLTKIDRFVTKCDIL